MAISLNIDEGEFIAACMEVESSDDLMEKFDLSRAQVKHLRQRLRVKGVELPKIRARDEKSDRLHDKGYNPTPKPFDVVKENLGNRLRYCYQMGWILDGKPVSVQTVMEIGKQEVAPYDF